MIKDRIWTLVSRKLSGEATALELAEIDELIKTKAYSDLYLQAINEYWNIPLEKDEEFLEATYHLHLERLKERGFDLETEKDESTPLYLDYDEPLPAKRSRKKIFLATGILAATAFTFFVFYTIKLKNTTSIPSKIQFAQSEVITKSGSRTRIQLPDGTMVWLNGSSKLVYDNNNFGEKIRQVTLSGEGYFDVVKNADKPFIIHTAKMDIKVLGTAFNVKAYPGEKNTETSLVRGTIEVTLKGHQEKITMKANDKLIVQNDDVTSGKKEVIASKKQTAASSGSFMYLGHLTLSPKDNTVIETAWVDNKLVFDNETFEDLAIKMERWYGVSIKFTHAKLKRAHFTGTFDKETVTDALTALQLTSAFTYSIKNDIITIANQNNIP